jgi:hypothetical protein
LATSSRCFVNLSPPQQKAIQIYLLCAIINGTAVTCDPNTLADDAKCFTGISPIQQEAMIVYLLCQIASGQGGTGATFGDYGGIAPNFTPQNGTGIAIDTSNQTLWVYDNGGWHNLV